MKAVMETGEKAEQQKYGKAIKKSGYAVVPAFCVCKNTRIAIAS